MALLCDLELRLGLPTEEVGQAERTARYAARLERLAGDAFYQSSFAADAWGTARELLRWRDALVEAGWDGKAIDGGGERLRKLAEVESLDVEPLPPGRGERLQTVVAELVRSGDSPYRRLQLGDRSIAWAGLWRALFAALAGGGCDVGDEPLPTPPRTGDDDLARLQRQILAGGKPVRPRGDGSLLLLRAETPWEAASATSAILRRLVDTEGATGLVVVRRGEEVALEAAVAAVGLPALGLVACHRLRPVYQVIALALELAFEPKDPRRIIELLVLPDGPFRGPTGILLGRAMSRMPGLGNREWERAKVLVGKLAAERAANRDEDTAGATSAVLERIEAWIERPGHPSDGAPRVRLLEVVARVEAWLAARLAARRSGPDDQKAQEEREHLLAASGHAAAVRAALSAWRREFVGLVAVRQIVSDALGGGGGASVAREQAGRIDHVATAAALRRGRDTVIWWNCLASTAELPEWLPFYRSEREALERSRIWLVAPSAAAAEAAAGWRRAVLLARRRLMLVAPRHARGEEVAVHPLWDELVARLGGDRRELARIEVDAREFLTGARDSVPAVATRVLPPALLPAPGPVWRLPPSHLAAPPNLAATSLETILQCPFRWALRDLAGLREGELASLPSNHELYGRLGHRLVETLHQQGAFDNPAEPFHAHAGAAFDELVAAEASTLLLPGRGAERLQVRDKLIGAVDRLAKWLASQCLRVVAIEQEEEAPWRGGMLRGRLDLVLADSEGREVILDLKWGRGTHRDKLRHGNAIQLAAYAWLRQQRTVPASPPRAGYFALARAELLLPDAMAIGERRTWPDAAETWTRVEGSMADLQDELGRGVVRVPGVRQAAEALAAGGQHEGTHCLSLAPDAGCGFCKHDAVCGRRWEADT